MNATNKERAEDAEAKLSKARTALRAMTNAVCGETGLAAVGGKDKTRIRNATPEPFRDLLLSIARGLPAQEQAA